MRTELQPADIIQRLNEVTNEVTLDLQGMAGALWAMAWADQASGSTNTPLFEGLHWIQRELDRKAEKIRDVTFTASRQMGRETS